MNRKYASAFDFVSSFVKPYWKQIGLLVILLLGSTGLTSLQPIVMAPIIDVVLGQGTLFGDSGAGETLSLSEVNLNNVDQYVSQLLNLGGLDAWNIVLLLSAAYLIVVVLKAALESISFYFFSWVRVHAYRNLQGAAYSHLLSLSLDYFNVQRSGGLVSRLNQDAQSSVTSLVDIVRALAIAPVTILFYGVLLVRTNLGLLLLVGGIGVVQWLAARALRLPLRRLVRQEFDLIADVHAYLQEVFQNIRVVKSFVAEAFERVRLRERVAQLIPVHIRRAMTRHWQEPIVVMINGFGNVAILLLSARELLNGNLSAPGFVLFLYLGRAMIPPITQLGQAYISAQEMAASAERVYQMVELTPSVVDGPKVKDAFEKEITFDAVSFSYGDEAVLRDVSLTIERGKMLALVGPSGAGKSTLTDLLLRFYDPTAGTLNIDGVDLREIHIEPYRRLFGVVAQENLLFNASIAENIAYGRKEVSVEQIKAAAEVANAAEFIEQLPKGYETLVGDRGIRLSGGQRQRVAIARAIVHRPEILILDEATSSLDTESERLVQAAIDRVIRETTAIVVAHRLSTVLHADKIVVLENGRVLDQGKHEELFERCALYKRLCQLQFQTNGRDPLVVQGQAVLEKTETELK